MVGVHMKIKIHRGQYEVATDEHKYKVINAGRQWGKSVLARLLVVKWALDKPGIYWIVSPTYRQGKENHWLDMKKEIPKQWIDKTNDTELTIYLKNGSVISLKGAENPDSLRGATLKGLCVDEIASIRNWEWLWSEVLAATLIRYDAPVIFISTPKGFNHFKEIYDRGTTENELWKSWHFTSYDNPYLLKEIIDEKKKELTEDTFAQEYMADFRKFTGLVYKEFNRETHVIAPFDIPDTWYWYRGFDFGTNNPFVCLWIAVDNDENWYICDEVYDSGSTTDTRAGMVNSKSFGKNVIASFGDPAGTQEMLDLSQKGVHISKANKETGQAAQGWVRFGIEKVSEKLKLVPGRPKPYKGGDMASGQDAVGSSKGYPSIFIFGSCVNTIREFETYRWKEKSTTQAQDLNEPDVPEKANDHAMDALRYFAVSYNKTDDSYDDINRGLASKWAI